MDLDKLINIQKQLDDRIIEKHNLQGRDIYHNTMLGLIVEIGELANEWQGFKHWKVDPQPKLGLLEEYVDCVHLFLSAAIQKGWQESLWIYEDAILELEESGLQGGITGAFLELTYWLGKSYMEKTVNGKVEKVFGISTQEFHFKNAWFLFMAIGLIGFKFTWEEIYQAYLDKNKVNHERQEAGY